jgi:menaquinol-cytochrome c reductase iron-sulfur subunit
VADEREPSPPEGVSEGSHLTRKEFLTKATIDVGGLMGAMIAVPVAGMALAPAVGGTDFEAVKLGNVDDFPEGRYTKVVLEPHKGDHDAYVKKRVAYVRRNADASADKLAPRGQGEFTVISNRCAHLGCPVQESGGTFVCPCHGGAYNEDGNRTAGPPVRPLDRFEWEQRGDELWAVDEYSLTSDGKRKATRAPGQHTGGPQGLLWPLQPSHL